jgi:hypothetical protein
VEEWEGDGVGLRGGWGEEEGGGAWSILGGDQLDLCSGQSR